jgi:hypothetical protein
MLSQNSRPASAGLFLAGPSRRVSQYFSQSALGRRRMVNSSARREALARIRSRSYRRLWETGETSRGLSRVRLRGAAQTSPAGRRRARGGLPPSGGRYRPGDGRCSHHVPFPQCNADWRGGRADDALAYSIGGAERSPTWFVITTDPAPYPPSSGSGLEPALRHLLGASYRSHPRAVCARPSLECHGR